MEISDIRIKLAESQADRLKAFATVTFDEVFVVRDIKIVDGANGPFVAMPSRKSTIACRKCNQRNPVQSRYCNSCAASLPPSPAPGADDAGDARTRVHRDIAHPITTEFRELLQQRILEAYHAEIEGVEDEFEDEEPITEAEMSEYDSLIADLRGVRAARAESGAGPTTGGRGRGPGRGRGERNGDRGGRDRGPRGEVRNAGSRESGQRDAGPRDGGRQGSGQPGRHDRPVRGEQPRREGPARPEHRPAAEVRPRQEQRPRPEPRYQQDRIVPLDDDDSFGDGLPATPVIDRPRRQERPARDEGGPRQGRGPRESQPRGEAPSRPAPQPTRHPAPAQPAAIVADDEDESFGEGIAAEPPQMPPARRSRGEESPRGQQSGRGERKERSGGRRGRQGGSGSATAEAVMEPDAPEEAPAAVAPRERGGSGSRMQAKPARPMSIAADVVSIKEADVPQVSADVNDDSAPFGAGIDD